MLIILYFCRLSYNFSFIIVHETVKKLVNFTIKGILPFVFAAAILWWMYRGFHWEEFSVALSQDMSWTWMLLSLPFGISAQVFRALRWREMLASLGEKVRLSTCIHSIFLSYASSLVVPRVGEVLRCGVLSRQDGANFSRLLGTVMSERVVDMLVVLVISSITMFLQIPVFMRFCSHTGMSLDALLGQFTSTGYLVTAICGVVALVTGVFILYKINIFSRTRTVLSELYAGRLSVFRLILPIGVWFHTGGIWASYYQHFYLTFRCFGFTEHLGPMVGLVAFVVGCFAVLVPTPNGAGPWHFAVKTVLVLYGVSADNGALFALVVHSIQTLLVALLGLYAMAALSFAKRRKNPFDTLNNI